MRILISYDLHKPKRDYEELFAAIKTIGTSSISPLESVWLVNTSKSPMQVTKELKLHIDADDDLFVSALTGLASWVKPNDELSEWLKENPA